MNSPGLLNARKMSWFMMPPVAASVLVGMLMAVILVAYQERHANRIYTGVMAWDVDLGGMSKDEAAQALESTFDYSKEESIVLINPKTDQQWVRSPAELGISFDIESMVDAAYRVGREGSVWERLGEQFGSWYYGRLVAPVMIFDEGGLDQAIVEIAAEINRPATDATLHFDGSSVEFEPAQTGLTLDTANTRARLMEPVSQLRAARVQLLVHEALPRIFDTSKAAEEIASIIAGPVTLYLQEPLAGVDLERISIPVEELVKWIRIETVEDSQGEVTPRVLIDENAFREWLVPYETLLRREPTSARFYFDDNTRELVLVEPHVNGRALDIDATVQLFAEKVMSTSRSMPFVLKEVVPAVHSRATSTELGIIELASESTTWFFGSSDERKHNIARAASNFYGIVIAPGQEFSFNHFLGEVSAEMGYETGLIIFGGRTIEGIGGGVCQVSTTVFQAAFWAGFPIVERWEHGYRVPYYDDGEGAGMDATVYSPIVDFRFVNDTPYYLLIENYYNEANSSLTFKFYSTSLGRTIIKEGPFIENVVPAKADIWELNEELQPGEIEQVDWAVEGADVTVVRRVQNSSGDLIRQDTFVSNYIPWQNIYQYGPGTTIPGSEPEAPEPTETPG